MNEMITLTTFIVYRRRFVHPLFNTDFENMWCLWLHNDIGGCHVKKITVGKKVDNDS